MSTNVGSKKRALCVVAGPYRFMQAIWLTYKYNSFDWDIAFIQYGKDSCTKFDLQCKAVDSKRFVHTYIVNSVTQYDSIIKKSKETLLMFLYWALGRKKAFCRKKIVQQIGQFDYDLLCVACSYSLFEGYILNFASVIPTILMQEGMDDYTINDNKFDFLTKIGGEILYKMGYANFLCKKDFFAYKYCSKFATMPERLVYKNYNKIFRMFDSAEIFNDSFNDIMAKIYKIDTSKHYDAILFTSALSNDAQYIIYKQKMVKWIIDKYANKKILLKRHPQDSFNYNFIGVDVDDLYRTIPGELIIQSFKNDKFIFEFPCTIMLDIMNKQNYQVFYFNNIQTSEYIIGFESAKDFIGIEKQQIIEI